MADTSDLGRGQSRRGVLSGVATTILLTGCLSGRSPGTESSATAPGTEPPSSTEPPTPSTSDTGTPALSASDAETPTPEPTAAANESDYPADQPLKPSSVSDSYSQWLHYDDPLFPSSDDVVPWKNGAIRAIRSREQWREVVTNATEQEDVDPFAYEFVDETDFATETVVIVQHAVIGGEWLRLLSVDGVGDPHVQLHVEQAGSQNINSFFYSYVFSRIPTDGAEIERITAVVDDGRRSARYVYLDEQTPA